MTETATFTYSALLQDSHSRLHYRIRQTSAPYAQDQTPVGRIFLLHGVGSNEIHMQSIADAIGAEHEVITVQSPLVLGPQQYAWFAVQFTAQGPSINAKQAEVGRLQLLQLVESLQQTRGVLPTVVAGFSQGAILSASAALTAPHAIAGFGMFSGRILPELEPHIAPANQLAKTQGFVAHGRYDDKLPITWAERAHAWLHQLGVKHELKLYDMGHTLATEELEDFNHWLAKLRHQKQIQ